MRHRPGTTSHAYTPSLVVVCGLMAGRCSSGSGTRYVELPYGSFLKSRTVAPANGCDVQPSRMVPLGSMKMMNAWKGSGEQSATIVTGRTPGPPGVRKNVCHVLPPTLVMAWLT